jgi:meckelin
MVDVFLLDWERPHPTAGGASSKDPSVSVWRTYLVANEWNELQAKRKTHLALQIFIVVFILRVRGVVKYAK